MNTSRLGKRNLKTTKTVSAVFHLNNKEAKRELKSQPQQQNPVLLLRTQILYLGVTLDRSLTYRRHLESLCKKLTSRGALLRRLAGSGWGAGATALRTVTLVTSSASAQHPPEIQCRQAVDSNNSLKRRKGGSRGSDSGDRLLKPQSTKKKLKLNMNLA